MVTSSPDDAAHDDAPINLLSDLPPDVLVLILARYHCHFHHASLSNTLVSAQPDPPGTHRSGAGARPTSPPPAQLLPSSTAAATTRASAPSRSRRSASARRSEGTTSLRRTGPCAASASWRCSTRRIGWRNWLLETSTASSPGETAASQPAARSLATSPACWGTGRASHASPRRRRSRRSRKECLLRGWLRAATTPCSSPTAAGCGAGGQVNTSARPRRPPLRAAAEAGRGARGAERGRGGGGPLPQRRGDRRRRHLQLGRRQVWTARARGRGAGPRERGPRESREEHEIGCVRRSPGSSLNWSRPWLASGSSPCRPGRAASRSP